LLDSVVDAIYFYHFRDFYLINRSKESRVGSFEVKWRGANMFSCVVPF